MIYSDFKMKLLSDLERDRDLLIAQESFKQPETLFEVTDNDDKLYMRILQMFNTIILKNVELLVLKLCKEKNVENSFGLRQDIYVKIDGEMKIIEFKTSPVSFNSERMRYYVNRQKETCAKMVFVFLLRDSVVARDSIRKFENRIKSFEKNAEIEIILFEEFIEKLFGYDEKMKFLQSMKDFKAEVHQVIGYRITELCSSANRVKLKKSLLTELKEFDYKTVKEEKNTVLKGYKNYVELSDADFLHIYERFQTNELYKLLLGDMDFAKSFLTSEWLYKKYFTLSELDNTFIVAGYLKSVEQMLWDIVLILGKGRTIQNTLISDENLNLLNKTLGSLEHFFEDRANLDLFRDVFGNNKGFVVKYLKSQIDLWRINYRNGYFHKRKLNERSTVENIRKETVYLYMIILGSIDLTSENIRSLMG